MTSSSSDMPLDAPLGSHLVSKQFALDLAQDNNYSANSFVTGPSTKEAIERLGILGYVNAPKWTNHCMAICGPSGSGKTHLGSIYCAQNGGLALNGQHDLPPSSNWKSQHIWLDNAQATDEFSLFALINMAISGEIKSLLLSAVAPPVDWVVELPDLASRLRNLQTISLTFPDQALLTDIVAKMFKDCGLVVAPNVIAYLLANTDRSLDALRHTVLYVDKASHEYQKNVTRHFVAKVLKERPVS